MGQGFGIGEDSFPEIFYHSIKRKECIRIADNPLFFQRILSSLPATKKKKILGSKASKRTRASSVHQSADSATGRARTFSGSSGDAFSPSASGLDLPVGSSEKTKGRKPRRSVVSSSSSPLEELPSPRERSSTNESVAGNKKAKRKGTRKSVSSRENHDVNKAKTKKRGFFRGSFGFGRNKSKTISANKENTPEGTHYDVVREPAAKLPRTEGGWTRSGRGSPKLPARAFSRNEPTRRSARDLIRDIEARTNGNMDVVSNKGISENHRSIFSKSSKANEPIPGKEAGKEKHVKLMGAKRVNMAEDPHGTPPKLKRQESLLQQIAR